MNNENFAKMVLVVTCCICITIVTLGLYIVSFASDKLHTESNQNRINELQETVEQQMELINILKR